MYNGIYTLVTPNMDGKGEEFRVAEVLNTVYGIDATKYFEKSLVFSTKAQADREVRNLINKRIKNKEYYTFFHYEVEVIRINKPFELILSSERNYTM